LIMITEYTNATEMSSMLTDGRPLPPVDPLSEALRIKKYFCW